MKGQIGQPLCKPKGVYLYLFADEEPFEGNGMLGQVTLFLRVEREMGLIQADLAVQW